jgi:hypothetical protein
MPCLRFASQERKEGAGKTELFYTMCTNTVYRLVQLTTVWVLGLFIYKEGPLGVAEIPLLWLDSIITIELDRGL